MLYNNCVCLYSDADEEAKVMKLFGKKNRVLTIIGAVLVIALTASLAFYAVHGVLRRSARQKAYDVKPITDQQIQTIIDNSKADKLMIVAHPDDDVIWGGAHLMDGDYYVVCITNGRNDTRKAEFEKMLEKSGNSGIILEYPDKVLGERDDWTYVWDKDKIGNRLNDHENEMTKVSRERFEYKDELVKVYESQESTVKKLWHMGPYEMWTQYEVHSEDINNKK